MTGIVLACADADRQAQALAESGDLDAAVTLLTEHAAVDGDPAATHHDIHARARLDTFSTSLLELPADNLFARRAATAHLTALLATAHDLEVSR